MTIAIKHIKKWSDQKLKAFIQDYQNRENVTLEMINGMTPVQKKPYEARLKYYRNARGQAIMELTLRKIR